MLQRALTLRRSTVPVVLAAGVLGTTVALAPVAAAEPARADQPSCAQLLDRAAHWPGSAGPYRLVSDAYVTHLASQPPCATRGE
jgi:hypothetical protein